jgi:uncharacterized protein YbjQ (UPF0145 family)
MLISTLSTYDMDKYEIMGPVSGLSVHSISFFRNLVSGFTSLFGGNQSLIKDKFLDVRKEAMADLSRKGAKQGADMIAGMEIELTELGNEFVVCVATGTALRLKPNGKRRSTKKQQQEEEED